MKDQAYLTDDKYSIYYMRSEGDFLYYYVVSIVFFFLVVLLAACCVGSCLFMGGSVGALTMVNGVLT